MKITRVALVAAACLGSAAAFAAASTADRDFATTAARDGADEVALGRLATMQGGSQTVKTFGQHMVDDHSKAGDALKAAAREDGVDLPADAGSKAPGSEPLAKLRGAEFDRAYASKMVEAHEQAVALFQREAKSDSGSKLQAFAQKTLPTLEQHLRMARELSAEAKADKTKEP